MTTSEGVSISSLGLLTSRGVSLHPTRSCIHYKLTSALVCGSRILDCLGSLTKLARRSGLRALDLSRVAHMGSIAPGDGAESIMTICCTCKRVSGNSSCSRNVGSRGMTGSLHSLHGSGGMGTIILHIGSPKKDTCNSRRV